MPKLHKATPCGPKPGEVSGLGAVSHIEEIMRLVESDYATPDAMDDPVWREAAAALIHLTSVDHLKRWVQAQGLEPSASLLRALTSKPSPGRSRPCA